MEKVAAALSFWSRFSSVPGDVTNVASYLPTAVVETARQHYGAEVPKTKGVPLLVLIHGTGSAPWQWIVARSYLRDAQLTHVFAVTYESRNRVDDSFQSVWEQVAERLPEETDVVFIGHSQGGLIARMVYERARSEFETTKFKVFVLHAPQHGTKAAGMWNGLLTSLGMRTRVKPSMKDMEKNSDFVDRYRDMCAQSTEPDPNVFEAAGSLDFVWPAEAFSCAPESNRFTGDYSHYSAMVSKALWEEFIIPNIISTCTAHDADLVDNASASTPTPTSTSLTPSS